jgi:uncharacterized protein YjiS (DUF1127 family)
MSMMQIAQRLHWQGLYRQGLYRHGLRRRDHSKRDWIALFKLWWRRARDREDLATMNDQSLRDIGITRYDAWHEARKPFWRA